MEILFKDDDKIFYIEDESLVWRYIINNKTIDLSNVPHLDDVEVLYHYKTNSGSLLPVYYEYDRDYLTKVRTKYIIFPIKDDIKDYTLINLKLL